MPPHPAAADPDALLRDCTVEHTRASGPGGQHRNKVSTAIVLLHQPTGITAQASERRSQSENHRIALFRLRVNLALKLRTPFPGRPSDLWLSRCRQGKISINPAHADFPALLAEALDALAAANLDAKAAAEQLGCSTSQLVRFLALEPAALDQLNRQRAALGLHRYA